jgi:hypothetical protein
MDEFRDLLAAEPQSDLRKRRFREIETFIHANERTIHEEQRAPTDPPGELRTGAAAPTS